MDYEQLKAGLTAMGIEFSENYITNHLNPPKEVPIDPLRASLYYKYLLDAQRYFNVELTRKVSAGGLGDNFVFVSSALQNASLLNELAKILDFYVSPAIQTDIYDQYKKHGHGPDGAKPWTYRNYFDEIIFKGDYTSNVNKFMGRYPITKYALDKLDTNFKANIKLCCKRVIADCADLKKFYNDLYPDIRISALIDIKSTGSDFHKGGKQVLILSFWGGWSGQHDFILKVVYKPGDIEVDCLIAGNSKAVNLVTPNFMQKSLFEIYNQQVAAAKKVDPNFSGEPLDTYHILPRKYNSANPAGFPLKIRESYGYIEFLNYDLTWGTASRDGFSNQSNQSDYLIFPDQDAKAIISTFYRKAGALCALASTFSIQDLHLQNFRVSKYNPYPIDLEISLTSAVSNISNTSLIKPQTGALNGVNVQGEDSYWVVVDADQAGQAFLLRVFPTITYDNRLFALRNDLQQIMVSVSNPDVLLGFTDGMQMLRNAQVAKDFDAWFGRLNNVVVRFTPYPTPKFKEIVINVFIYQPEKEFLPTLKTELLNTITNEYSKYGNGDLPRFLAFDSGQSSPDYQNLDIPVFYFLIAPQSKNIINSLGEIVPIPDTIRTLNNSRASCKTRVGRDTFFPDQPTENVVRGPQVIALRDFATYENRLIKIEESIAKILGTNQVPESSTIIILPEGQP